MTITTTSSSCNSSSNDDTNVTPISFSNKSPILQLCQHLLLPDGRIVGSDVAQLVISQYPTILSAIPSPPSLSICRNSDGRSNTSGDHAAAPLVEPYHHPLSTTTTNTPATTVEQHDSSSHNKNQHYAIRSIDGRVGLTHVQVITAIQEFGTALHALPYPIGRGSRIALILPNGPELGLAILCVSQYAACVPLSATGAVAEWSADLQRCDADLVMALHNDPTFDAIQSCAMEWNIPTVGLVPSTTHAGKFTIQPDAMKLPTRIHTTTRYKDQLPNGPEDEVLVLFTSGTTGNKKLVPHLQGDILTAATIIALSWNLSYDDINCNMMPLFHVGGIVRQIFAPILAGSTVICCPNFDPTLFWTLLSQPSTRFTWYYAAPTMHQLILQMGKEEQHIVDGRSSYPLKMIANAAGGLLPSLANEMRHVFHGVHVLPSYGMTECMPISSPPFQYNLEKPGTSGVPVGPEVAILNLVTGQSLPPMQEGPICVRGSPCFRGYGVIGPTTDGNTVPPPPPPTTQHG